MKSVSFYSFSDKSSNGLNNCSLESHDAPLIVNCAGDFQTEIPFTTDNSQGRADYYLMHVISGTLRVRMPNGFEKASAGDTIIFPPCYKYFYTYESEKEGLNYLWVHFTGSAAEYYLKDLGFSPLPAIFRSRSESLADFNFRAMFDLFPREDELRSHALSAVLLNILVELARSRKEAKKQPTISRSLAYLSNHYTEDIRISELATMENLSSSRYHVIFKQTTGIAPSEYIIALRIRHACELLSTTNMSVGQVGALVGYDNQHFFSKIFKQKTGVSPLGYRKGIEGLFI